MCYSWGNRRFCRAQMRKKKLWMVPAGFAILIASADFSQFVVTTAFFSNDVYFMLPVRSPRVLTHSFTLIPAMFTASDSVQLLGFDLTGSLTLVCSLT